MGAEFDKAVATAPKLEKGVTNDEKLELYALFKVGNNSSIEGVPKPGTFEFEKKYKYNAWKAKADEGLSVKDAQAQYVKTVNDLVKKYGLQS